MRCWACARVIEQDTDNRSNRASRCVNSKMLLEAFREERTAQMDRRDRQAGECMKGSMRRSS